MLFSGERNIFVQGQVVPTGVANVRVAQTLPPPKSKRVERAREAGMTAEKLQKTRHLPQNTRAEQFCRHYVDPKYVDMHTEC